jgi:plasmid stabilization system protein ParE
VKGHTLAIVFRSSAARQVATAQAWYEVQRKGLGAEFALNLEAATQRAARNPEHFPIVQGQVRRAFLKRFPYALFFLAESDRMVVLSCLHTRQDPNI